MTQDGDKILSNEVTNGDLKNIISITRGEGVEALLLFKGCSVNEYEECLVTADYVIEAPDGSIFSQQLNTEVWKDPMRARKDWSLTNTRVGFLAPSNAETGAYKIQVTVYDNLSKKQLSLTGHVEVSIRLSGNDDSSKGHEQTL
jgi:hypothetical protein